MNFWTLLAKTDDSFRLMGDGDSAVLLLLLGIGCVLTAGLVAFFYFAIRSDTRTPCD